MYALQIRLLSIPRRITSNDSGVLNHGDTSVGYLGNRVQAHAQERHANTASMTHRDLCQVVEHVAVSDLFCLIWKGHHC